MDDTDNIEMAESEKERIHETEEEEEKGEEDGNIHFLPFLRDLNLLITLLSLISEDTCSTSQEEEQRKVTADDIPRIHNKSHISRHQELQQPQRKPRFQTTIKDFRHGKRM
ncbi:hypothetical protein HS088_TW18G00462 [Tripterygium wilfordii]|uniref:Uncharacterized protein n=1 Tax=Tripterygium wilfordii TaxID=458696 RepID=A0A7J7CD20_TRIWF|nr:uncharacterized protein LOC119984608 [Tripterygium wilfordii]KAF5731777.1 hypothetical protein HS088_TW18G00462 [Tripterygium wilfordii]